MKARILRTLIVFLLGMGSGYLVAQEPVQAQLIIWLNDGWKITKEQVGKWAQEFNKSSKQETTAGNSNAPVAPAPSPKPQLPPTPVDKGQYIRQSIELSDIQGRLDDSSDRSAVVTGTVRNKGNHPLRQVDISLFFIDKDNIFFETRVPAISNSMVPPGSAQAFSIKIPNLPPPGIKGKIRASVIDVVFAP